MSQMREITCREVLKEMVDYTEGELSPKTRERFDSHMRDCAYCRAIYSSSRNILRLLADERVLELPSGFGRRLYQRLNQNIK